MPRAVDHPVSNKYKNLANAYDRRWLRYNTSQTEWIIAQLQNCIKIENLKRPHVIDLACGTANALNAIAVALPQNKRQLNGFDISPEMLALAQQKLPDADFKIIDLDIAINREEIRAQYKDCDIVLSLSALHHMREAIAHLKLLDHLCKPGGKIYISDFSLSNIVMKTADIYFKVFHDFYYKSYGPDILENMIKNEISGKITAKKILKPGIFWRIQIYEITKE